MRVDTFNIIVMGVILAIVIFAFGFIVIPGIFISIQDMDKLETFCENLNMEYYVDEQDFCWDKPNNKLYRIVEEMGGYMDMRIVNIKLAKEVVVLE